MPRHDARPRVGRRQEEEKKAPMDTEMAHEVVKKPTKKPAPKKETPKTGKQPGKGSAAVAPNVNEHDLGVGMSKEEAW